MGAPETEALYRYTGFSGPRVKVQRPVARGTYLLMEETLGTVSLSQTPSARSRSRISQANMVGFCRL